MLDLKYNYIIVGGSGFYDVAYSDLKSLPNVQYFSSYLDGVKSSLLRFLTRANFNLRINRYIRSPFRHIVFPLLLPVSFVCKKSLCFIFFNLHFSIFKSGYIEYLRKKYPNAKFVLYMQDIVNSSSYYDIIDYKNRFDLVLSYDMADSTKYKLIYYPTPYSFIETTSLKKQDQVDVYFCGKAKNRYQKIIEVYQKCKRAGLSCRFYISDVSTNTKLLTDEIIYDTPLSYADNLSYVISCKCILEIMQKDADGFTPRLWEAMFYGKHLLTNNSIVFSRYSNNCSIHHIEGINKISDWINQKANWLDDLVRSKSPIHLLTTIEKELS